MVAIAALAAFATAVLVVMHPWAGKPSIAGDPSIPAYPLNYQIDYVSKIVAASGGGAITGHSWSCNNVTGMPYPTYPRSRNVHSFNRGENVTDIVYVLGWRNNNYQYMNWEFTDGSTCENSVVNAEGSCQPARYLGPVTVNGVPCNEWATNCSWSGGNYTITVIWTADGTQPVESSFTTQNMYYQTSFSNMNTNGVNVQSLYALPASCPTVPPS